MTLKELVEYLRLNILDDEAGHDIDWTTIFETDAEAVLLRWSNEQLTAFINEAINQVYRRVLPVQKYEPCFDITVVIGVAEYPIDPRILRIINVRAVTLDRYLKEVDHQDLINSSNTWESQTGDPIKYLIDYGSSSIRLYRTPIAGDTLQLLVNRLPLDKLDWSNFDESPELRDEFQIQMLHYAAHLAYLKEDANTLDPNKSAAHLSLFNAEFPATNAYSDTRKRRTINRPIAYGGI